FSMVGAACFYWLERLQPVFFALALFALAYEIWLVRRRPGGMRSWSIRAMIAFSLGVNAMVAGTWVFLWFRYR
ncbi:MAG: hypothetical protein IT185_12445, partial [Acidobacteria bacterium]|nr:hypothetical protein [Acidobacteriota bacterium]